MITPEVPPLPGVDVEGAPDPDDPEYEAWLRQVAFSPTGVDLMQIWVMLHRTPTERLRLLESYVNGILELRGGRRSGIP
jgi:hypothetical protein